MLPIRSCIEAFLKGDETALQTVLVQSAPELQKALADTAVGLKQHAAANAQHVSHGRYSRSRPTPDGSCQSTPSVLVVGKHEALHSNDDGLSAKSYVAGVRLGPDSAGGSSEVLLHPPRAPDVQRSAHSTVSDTTGQMSPHASQGAALLPMHHCRSMEPEVGCDQLVQYVLREFLG